MPKRTYNAVARLTVHTDTVEQREARRHRIINIPELKIGDVVQIRERRLVGNFTDDRYIHSQKSYQVKQGIVTEMYNTGILVQGEQFRDFVNMGALRCGDVRLEVCNG